jgi:hypothetical protein
MGIKLIDKIVRIFTISLFFVIAGTIFYYYSIEPRIICSGDYLLRISNMEEREKYINKCLKGNCIMAFRYYMYWDSRNLKNIPDGLDERLIECIKLNGGIEYTIENNKIIRLRKHELSK